MRTLRRHPPLKYEINPLARQRLEKIAEFHGIGTNEPSANEVSKIGTLQLSLVKPAKFFEALAALKPFQVTNPFALAAFGPKRPRKTLLG